MRKRSERANQKSLYLHSTRPNEEISNRVTALSRQLEKLKSSFFIHQPIFHIMSSFQVFRIHNDGKPGPKHVAAFAFALAAKSQKTLQNQVQPSPKTIRPHQERFAPLGSFDLCRSRAQLMTCLGSRRRLKTSYVDILSGANIGRWNGGNKQLHEALSRGTRQSPPPLPLLPQLELVRYSSQPLLCRVPSVSSTPRLVLRKISGREVIGGFQR